MHIYMDKGDKLDISQPLTHGLSLNQKVDLVKINKQVSGVKDFTLNEGSSST